MAYEMLAYGFMQKAFVTGIVIAVACSLLGVFLILRRYSLIGDGLAHISFGGVACGLLIGVAPFWGALAFAVIGSLGILNLKEKARVHGDTAIGIISHASLGIGVFIVSIAHGFNVDILSYLFGSILAIKAAEVASSVLLAGAVILTIILFYHDLLSLAFDEESARTAGVRVDMLNTLLITLTAVTIVSSMNVVGLMLASSMIILPAATALQLAQSFKRTLVLSAALAAFSVTAGLILSYENDWAASGTIVLTNTLVFLAVLLAKGVRAQILVNRRG